MTKRVWQIATALLIPLVLASCAGPREPVVALPAKHKLDTDQLLVRSDIKLPEDDPLIKDLLKMRQQVSQTLDLPLNSRPVHVYLFGSEETYRKYWTVNFPGYPLRRAYFVQTPDRELAVYTYWGDRIQEDLRHEYTHGLLHSSTDTVPLWLDEGIAEYFEVPGKQPGGVNPDDIRRLTEAIRNGWRPGLERLERLEKVEQMQRADYREAWAWVHYMLHGSPDTPQILLGYLRELRTNPNPPPLSGRLRSEVPELDKRMLSYVGSLSSRTFQSAAFPDSGKTSGETKLGRAGVRAAH